MNGKADEKPIPWAKLLKEDRDRVLETMIDGIHGRFDTWIKHAAHQQFTQSLATGEPFDPAAVWSGLQVTTQNHFEHARQSIEILERALDGDPPKVAAQQSAPKKPAPKQQQKKKKGR